MAVTFHAFGIQQHKRGNEWQQIPHLRFGLVFWGVRPEVALSSLATTTTVRLSLAGDDCRVRSGEELSGWLD